MKYNTQISTENKWKWLLIFYIKLNIWINTAKANGSHFIYCEILSPFLI